MFDRLRSLIDERIGDFRPPPPDEAMMNGPFERFTEAEQARPKVRMVVASIVGLWACYFLLLTLRGFVLGLEWQEPLIWRRLAVTLAGVAVTFVLWMGLRLFERNRFAMRTAAALLLALPASLVIAQFNQWVFAPVQENYLRAYGDSQGVVLRRDETGNLLLDVPLVTGRQSEEGSSSSAPVESRTVILSPAPSGSERWRILTDVAIGRYFMLLAWAALYFAMLAGAQARAAQAREERFRTAAKAAELRSLRYQINPHFLFNTLNSLSSLVITGREARAEAMIQAVSNFYRHSLAEEPTEDAALEDEIALQRDYLAIEEVRFPERLQVDISMPEDLARARVPGMILQPLVENSVRYAVARSTTPVNVSIEAFADANRLHLVVADDGPGLPDDAGHGFGIGLSNVRDRLHARFGDKAKVLSGRGEDGGYRTELIMPLDLKNVR